MWFATKLVLVKQFLPRVASHANQVSVSRQQPMADLPLNRAVSCVQTRLPTPRKGTVFKVSLADDCSWGRGGSKAFWCSAARPPRPALPPQKNHLNPYVCLSPRVNQALVDCARGQFTTLSVWPTRLRRAILVQNTEVRVSSTTKWPTRVVFFFLAMLFLIPIVASGVYVIYQSKNNNKQQGDSSLNTNTNTLAGTKLANFTPISTPVSQLQTIDTTVGSGAEVKAGDTVTVNYTGALVATGVIFESSLDSGQPATFGLSQVIPGWTNGIPGMKIGGTRRLIIPAAQAYGASGQGSIPPNADLVFDVTLVSIGQ